MPTEIYLTPDELSARLRADGPRSVVDSHVLQGLPYVFRDTPEVYDYLRHDLSESLHVQESSFVVVGSGRTGFSLEEGKFGIPFNQDSDIDVSVISERLFDEVWLDLLRVTRSRAAGLNPRVRANLEAHRTKRIFYGRAFPHQLQGAAQLTGRWFRAFKSVGRRVYELSPYVVNGMLFRTWEHARIYYTYGLSRVLQDMLRRRP